MFDFSSLNHEADSHSTLQHVIKHMLDYFAVAKRECLECMEGLMA